MKKVSKLKVYLALLGISASSLLLTGCAEKDYPATVLFHSVLDDTEDSTLLDEILYEEENQELSANIYLLEKYLSFSEKLNLLELEELSDEDRKNEYSILSKEDMEKYIRKFESIIPSDKEYKEMKKILKYNEEKINEWLHQNGLSVIAKAASLVGKAKVVDSLELDITDYERISLLENPDDYDTSGECLKVKYSRLQGDEYSYKLQKSDTYDAYISRNDFDLAIKENKLAQLIHVVDECKRLSPNYLKEEDSSLYSEDLNEKLNLFLGIIRSSMYAQFYEEDGFILQYPENDEVNAIYEEKIKSLGK